jgi:hypothetical protein
MNHDVYVIPETAKFMALSELQTSLETKVVRIKPSLATIVARIVAVCLKHKFMNELWKITKWLGQTVLVDNCNKCLRGRKKSVFTTYQM